MLGPIVFAVVFVAIGLSAVWKKHIEWNVGTRYGRGNPIFMFKLNHARAVVFGLVSSLLGILIISLALYWSWIPTAENLKQHEELLALVSVLASIIVALTFAIEVYIEFVVQLQNRPKKKKNSDL